MSSRRLAALLRSSRATLISRPVPPSRPRPLLLVSVALLVGVPAAHAAPPDGEVACRGLIALDRRLATLDRQFGELNPADPPEILAPKQKDLLELMRADAVSLRKVLTQTGKPLGNEAADKHLPDFQAKVARFLGWFDKPDVELTDDQERQVTDAVGEYRFEVGQSCDYYAPYNPETDPEGRNGDAYPPGHNGFGDYSPEHP